MTAGDEVCFDVARLSEMTSNLGRASGRSSGR